TFRLARDRAPRIRYAELRDAVARQTSLEAVSSAQAVKVVRETVLALRRGKSMVLDPSDPNTRSVGSFFTNPVLAPPAFARLEERWRDTGAGQGTPIPTFPADGGVKVPAAWLVERAGFAKGYRRGGAGISSRHALALVNFGGTSAELLALAESVREGVAARFGLRLEFEPEVVPVTILDRVRGSPWGG